MGRSKGRHLSILIAVAISAVLLGLALYQVDLKEVLHVLRNIQWYWLPLLGALPILDLWFRAVRWRLLMSGWARPSSMVLFRLESIGLAINNILFLRLGELARAYLAGKELELPTLSVLATILVERLCDTAALLFLFWLVALGVPETIHSGLRNFTGLTVVLIILFLLGLAILGESFRRHAHWSRILEGKPRLRHVLEELILGTRVLRSWRISLKVAGMSLGLWLCDAGLYWIAGYALGLDPNLSYGDSVIVLATAAVSSIVPMVPGSWGGFEAAVQAVLIHKGYGASIALGYGAMVHLIMYLVVTGLGIIFLYSLGHTLSSLSQFLERP